MRSKASPSGYLAFLTVKYEVDPDSFFDALISSSENRKSTCGNLTIESRGKHRNQIMFLITKGSKVVAQFPIPEEFLLERSSNPIKHARTTGILGKHPSMKDRGSRSVQIGDLRAGMKKVNLKARVLEIANPKPVLTRFGNYATVANALIADETGQIKLCLWNEQIDSVSIGDTVQVENASTSTFRGERQLRIGRKGILRNLGELVSLAREST